MIFRDELCKVDSRGEFLLWLEGVRDYFLTTPDYQTQIWYLMDGWTSEILVGNKDFRFNDAPWWITIIDSYGGRQPILLNREYFLYDSVPFIVSPTVLLDSQVVNALHTYVTSPNALNTPMREAIRSFLSFVKGRFEFSAIFYFAEMAAKSNPKKRELYARERAAMIFALQTMDVQEFSQTGRVIPDPAAQAAHLAYNGIGSVEEFISRYAGFACDALAQKVALNVDLSYASLLKIALVQRQMRGDILTKYRAVREFMEHSLGIVPGEERTLALCYFARPQRYQRFIHPLQPGMRFAKFCNDLRASAWDLFLVRLPEQILGMSTPGSGVVSRSCCLSYVCTAEHALRDIMSSRSIETLYQFEP